MRKFLLALPLLVFSSAAQTTQRLPPPALTEAADLPDELSKISTQPSPEPFIQELYRELQQTPAPAPFVGAHGASHIYADPLLSSMHKEYAHSTRGFAGQLDFNPFCSCQDPAGLTLTPITLTATDKRHTDASFKVHFAPIAGNDVPDRAITLHLVRNDHGWRVDDISSAQVRSFKLLMRDPTHSNADSTSKP